MNYRQEAKDRDCQVRLPGCQNRTDTTVLAHLGGAGMALKRDDRIGAHCCHYCHDRIDGRVKAYWYTGDRMSRAELRAVHLEAIIRTQELLISEGKL